LPNREDDLIAWFKAAVASVPVGTIEAVPVGTIENSPAIHRWESGQYKRMRPVGTREHAVDALSAINDARGADLRASLRDAIARVERQPSDKSLGFFRAVPPGRKSAAGQFRDRIPIWHEMFCRSDRTYTKRAAETAWTYLAFDSVSPYIDTRPPLVANQAEQRRYRMRYRDADVPIGEFSDTLTVTVGPVRFMLTDGDYCFGQIPRRSH
jgi:hypothetical protein